MARALKAFLAFLFLFGLAHASWIPRKLGVNPIDVPFGVLNMMLVLGVALWFLGFLSGGQQRNPIRPYGWFIGIVILWILVAAVTGYDSDFIETLRTAKAQVALLFVYFIPLALVKDESDFKFIFGASLLVHFLIGIEVVRSGVLGGVNFHDMKRGSGPFGVAYWGSDVAASYLAQTLMLFMGGVLGFFRRPAVSALFACAAAILLVGVYATYSRGALMAVVSGMFVLVFAKKFNWKIVAAVAVFVAVGISLMPEATKARFMGTFQEDGDIDESSRGRMYYYDIALKIAASNPLGVGTAQIRGAMLRYTSAYADDGEGKYVDPHNSFLQILCEQSILGVLVFLACLWQMTRIALQGARSSHDSGLSYSSYSTSMVGFMVAFVVCNMFYANFHKELAMGMVTWHFGLLSVAENARRKAEDIRDMEPRDVPDGA